MPSSPISPPDNIRLLHGENGILGYGQIVPDDQTYRLLD